jgi:hypothetical protein
MTRKRYNTNVIALAVLCGVGFICAVTNGDSTSNNVTIEGARISTMTPDGKPVLVLIWDPFGPDILYHIEVSDTKDFKKILVRADSSGNASIAGVVTYTVNQIPISPQTKYFYRISSSKSGGTTVPTTPVQPSTNTYTPDSFLPAGLHLQKSFSDKQLADGAVFSYSRPSSSNESETYSADFALVYKPQSALNNVHFVPNRGDEYERDQVSIFGVIEGHVSSDPNPKASEHNFIAQLGFDDFLKWSSTETKKFDSFYTYSTTAVRYESTQRGDVQKLLASVRIFPIFAPIGAGREKILPDWNDYDGDKSSIGFIHEESFGADVGGTTRGVSNSTLESDNTVGRLVVHFRPELRLNFLKGFVPKGVSVYGDDTFNYLISSRRPANFVQAGVNLQFTDNLGLQFFYKEGEAPPQFNKVESINVGITAKF